MRPGVIPAAALGATSPVPVRLDPCHVCWQTGRRHRLVLQADGEPVIVAGWEPCPRCRGAGYVEVVGWL